ncbi:MAG: hypothetical protein HDS72_00320 [Bacteroidales bacterium]|nr:hypothetical protein [Bacteroidales bacterium]
MNNIIITLTLIIGISGVAFSQKNMESPYAIFGDRTPVRDVEHTSMDTPWQIYVLLPDSTIAKMELCGENLVLTDCEKNVLAKFRISNTSKALFSGADPKAAEMPSASPYSYCFGNPILFVDPDGEEPTPYQSALMCSAVYRDHTIQKGEIHSNFQILLKELQNEKWYVYHGFDKKIQLNHRAKTNIGMQAMIFYRDNDGTKEYALVFAGTNSLEDMFEDLSQLYGYSPQVSMALKAVKQLKTLIGDSELTVLGHSFGAVLASAASMKTGIKAITFNPAVISKPTKFFHGLRGEGNIVNYIESSSTIFGIQRTADYVTLGQSFLGLHAPGQVIPIDVNFFLTHGIDGIVNALKARK